VFCRFAGCNLWSGREADRAQAVCTFCDTDFIGTDGPGGGLFAAAGTLVNAVKAIWPANSGGVPYVVCTGGEPLLQLGAGLVDAFHSAGIEVAVETNGTRLPPNGIDWITMSPKAGAPLLLTTGNELKLVYPQAAAPPEMYAGLCFGLFYLQPMDGPKRAQNTQMAIEYCMAHPQWRLCIQTHKVIGLR
jgi:7-carboxy-7-deazaguanine synthase (Cx14CxxC type)